MGLLSFPEQLIDEVDKICTRTLKESQDPDKKYLQLNRVEEYLLKPVIPFIRIGHLPRGRYFQLKGDLIMVSADVVESMNNILPREQKLLPVSLKRKLEYSGYYMQEYVDRDKLQVYFRWFQQHNHLFKDMVLDEDKIDKFEKDAQAAVEEMDLEKNKLFTDHDTIKNYANRIHDEFYDLDGEENLINVELEKEIVVSDHSSVITNKYVEDTNAPTVANKFSDLIIELEKLLPSVREDSVVLDPEESCYLEDEIYMSDDEDYEEISDDLLNFEEMIILKSMKKIKMENLEDMYWLKTDSNLKKLCKCDVTKKIASLMESKYKLEKVKVEDDSSIAFKNELLTEFSYCIENSRKYLQSLVKNCHHTFNELNDDIENIIKDNEKNPQKTFEFVRNQTKKIKENVKKLSLAPAEEGKWMNWQSDLFLEEKLFPRLFPYGIGGFLSSNMLKKSNMGYSNYIKNRLLSADPKFRNDPSYVFFLLLVKELTDMKRSEQTYFRKATKAPNLTAKKVNEITKEHLFRYNNAFQTYKSCRGTTMYYQDIKKKLMATLRQKGAPTLFTTFSCAEFDWNFLAKQIYQTVNKTEVSMEFIKAQSPAWKNKLVSENVTQSTVHFSKRTDKIMRFISNKGIFKHDGIEFVADSYFYRVEFQQR